MNIGKWSKGLRLRLLAVSIVPVVSLAIVSYFGVVTARNLHAEVYKANEVRGRLIENAGDMEAAIHATVRMAWTALNMDDPKEKAAAVQKTKEYIAEFDETKGQYVKLPQSQNMVDMFKVIEANWPIAKKEFEGLFALIEKNPADIRTAGPAVIISQIRPPMMLITERLNEMQVVRREATQKELVQIEHDTVMASRILIIVSVVAGLLSMVMGITIAVKTAGAVMGVTNILNSSSLHVSTAATQIASSSEQLSEASSEQAASLEETVSTMEELSSMVKANAQNAKEASRLSQETNNSANAGEQEIRNLVLSMKEISSDSKKIEEIISVIEDIAFQTNLLALNAAVEAARAGEQGKGFAVVAEAVRTLAQRSASASKDITSLIKGSVQKVETGSKQADQSGKVLEVIVTSVKKVTDLNAEISSASQEQSNGIAQINIALNQLDQVTQVNAATSEEAAASAQELSAQTEALKKAVRQLVQLVEGGSGEDAPEYSA